MVIHQLEAEGPLRIPASHGEPEGCGVSIPDIKETAEFVYPVIYSIQLITRLLIAKPNWSVIPEIHTM
jgi:hypothetical protein